MSQSNPPLYYPLPDWMTVEQALELQQEIPGSKVVRGCDYVRGSTDGLALSITRAQLKDTHIAVGRMEIDRND